MDNSVLVAVLSLLGTAFGSVAGILAANRLVVYRIEQLEQKVAKHNNLVERVYRLESRVEVMEKQNG
ncbi:MAG: hypothetical protein IKH18_03070 [Clostridia bacterium]|nr:hypothetical protein [Clostridia bacterium]